MKSRDQWTSEEEDAWIRAHETQDDFDEGRGLFSIGRDVFMAALLVLAAVAVAMALLVNSGCCVPCPSARDIRDADWSTGKK